MQTVPTLTTRALDAALEPGWRDFVASQERTLFYASLEFRDLVQTVLGAAPRYLVALRGGRVVGALPAFTSADRGGGVVLNSLPYYGSNGGPIAGGDAAVGGGILAAYLELERDSDCVASTLISSPLEGTHAAYETGLNPTFRDERIGQVTELPDPAEDAEEHLFARYDESARRNVRKARKSGVTMRSASDRAALEYLHRTHHDNIRAIGGLPKDWSFFEAVLARVSQRHWTVYLAEREGQPIAALLVFRFNRTVEYYTPAITAAFRGVQPLALLVHEAMCEAASDGYRWWNWGGTWLTQEGVYRFKKKWGAQDSQYYYYTRVRDQSVLKKSQHELLASFPGFYVAPFNKLPGAVPARAGSSLTA